MKKLILGRPKLLAEVYCPKCKDHFINSTPNMEITCTNCHTSNIVPVSVSIYYSAAKRLNNLLSSNDEVWVLSQRENSQVFYPDDELKPRTKLENEMYQAMLAIQRDFQQMKSWEVSDIENDVDFEYRQYCKSCGYCKNCVRCTKCNHVYSPTRVKKSQEIRHTCPECGHKKYQDATILEFEKEKGKQICPYCKGMDIRKTQMMNRKQCPKCGSEDLTEPKKINVYKLTIKRQKRFRIG